MSIENATRCFPVQESIVDDIDKWAIRAADFIGAELRRASDAGLPMTTELVRAAQDAARWIVTGLLEYGQAVGGDHRELLRACRDRLQADEDLEQRVRAETRASVLAEEERRVWCEAYAFSSREAIYGIAIDHPAVADRVLAAYREAQRAWDARKEKE